VRRSERNLAGGGKRDSFAIQGERGMDRVGFIGSQSPIGGLCMSSSGICVMENAFYFLVVRSWNVEARIKKLSRGRSATKCSPALM